MKVWCSVHDSKQWQADLRPEYAVVGECERFVIHRLVLGFDHEVPCVFDEMQLVPADALVIEKENGEWPERVTNAMLSVFMQVAVSGAHIHPSDALDALAEAQPPPAGE